MCLFQIGSSFICKKNSYNNQTLYKNKNYRKPNLESNVMYGLATEAG